jgi:sugar lactone lactonase YvrE
MAVDGDVIWVMTALRSQLQRISIAAGEVEMTYTIDAYVEGVVVGGGYLWLLSYDHGGEVLRFDPTSGIVDLTIPLGGSPGGARWFGDSLWVSNEQGRLHQFSMEGEILFTGSGEIKGEGLGYLWVNDPETGLISGLSEDGTRGEIEIPTVTGADTMSGGGVRTVTEAGGDLWLMDGDYPWGTNLSRFDPDTGEFGSFGGLTFGLLDMTEFEGSLWVTSHTDHLLIRVDPESGEVRRFPMPGKAGGVVEADGSLWVTLYHPGALVRLDPNADLIQSAEIVADDWNRFPHRLLCTGTAEAGGPTVILEPHDWIEYGSWSVIQAQLSNQGYVVCANGYLEGEATPEQRVADLSEALKEAGISGPYVLVAAGDGVHSTRLFADGNSDIAGVVLVDPVPVGFQDLMDSLFAPDSRTPTWLDLDQAVSDSLDDFGDHPLVVVEGDPEAVFLSQNFINGQGRERAETLNSAWAAGLAFYAGLSTESTSVVADGTGLHMVVWDQPDLVVERVLDVLARTDR